MANFFKVLLITALVAACSASPSHLRSARLQKNRFLARQEVEQESVPAVTPYPAAGFKPEVAFDLPTETVKTIDDPDNTYLPPAEEVPSPRTFKAPAQTYGPPDAKFPESEVVFEDDAEEGSTPGEQPEEDNSEILPFAEPQTGRLVLARKTAAKPAKLLQLRPVSSSKRSLIKR